MADPEIPNKLFFQIGEASRLLGLEPHVLRFWETEFPMLNPTKGANGRRLYRKKDVELALAIKQLLYEQGFTIAGARNRLAGRSAGSAAPQPVVSASSRKSRPEDPSQLLQQLKSELRNLLTILDGRC
jgi:DNA-binding transcriptional MerR regulator